MDSFEKLKLALVIISIKGDLRQPQNYAMGRIPRGHFHWHTAQQYLYDIERIFRELSAASSFVTQLPDDSFFKTHSISREDYIMYHQGYFLDLVHQLKDKLTQSIRALTASDKDYIQKKLGKKAKLSILLKDPKIEKIPMLQSLLREWDDETQNGVIAKALKKRIQYHHFKNPLPGVESYMRANALRFMLDPKFSDQLSDYGKKTLLEQAEEHSQLWQSDGSAKMKEILDTVTENVDAIAKVLLKYYQFPSSRQGVSLINEYLKIDGRVRAKKSSHKLNLIPSKVRNNLGIAGELLTNIFGAQLRAVYTTGSIFRDDFIPGVSDLNLIIITKDRNKKEELIAKILMKGISEQSWMHIQSEMFSEEEFMSSDAEKYRFFCLTDGVLLIGEDLLKKEKTPKICFNLAWLLNKDFKSYVAAIKVELADPNTVLSGGKLSFIARDFVKRAYRLSFSMVMGNQVLYTPSFKEMRHLQNYYYPTNKKLNESLYRLLKAGIKVDKQTLLEAVQRYEEALMKLYDTMEKYCDKDNPQLEISDDESLP